MSPEPRKGPADAWTPLRLFRLTAFWFALSFHFAVLYSLVLQRQVERFAPEALQGTALAGLTALAAVTSALVQFLVGHWSDRTATRWGRRRPYLVAGTLLSLGSLALMARADSLASVALALLCLQVTINLAAGPYQALLPDLVPRERHGRASSWMGIMRNLGDAAGPLVAGAWLGGQVAPIMGVDALLLVALMLVTVLGIREPARAAEVGGGGGLLEAFRIPLRPYPDFARLLWSRAVINVGFYTALTFFYFYVQHSLAVPDYRQATGKLLFGVILAGLVGALPAGPLGDRHDKVRLVFLANGLTSVAAVVFVLAGDLRTAAAAGVFMGLGFGAFTVLDWALAFALLPSGGSARYLALWNLATVGPMVLAPALAGPLTDLLRTGFGPGLAYRAAMGSVVLYLVAGTWLLRGLRVRPGAGECDS